MALKQRFKRIWNIFNNRDPTGFTSKGAFQDYGPSYYQRPDRPQFTKGNARSIVTSIYNRIAMDAAQISIQHVKLDENGRFLEAINSGLNYCLTEEANIDQAARAFRQDIYMSLLDEGSVAIVPIDWDDGSEDAHNNEEGYRDILTMRTGKIVEWKPMHVKVRLYNEETGKPEEIYLEKKDAMIVESPLYSVINEPNSTMQRLSRKLALLDAVDERTNSGKLDLIIQLPYVVKTEARRIQANKRRSEVERQLAEGKYGIAYTDGTERITQLNRPVENNLMKQIEYLTDMLFSQLGFTQGILDGSADEKTMLGYDNRTIEPFVTAVVEEVNRKCLTRTARKNREKVMFFRDPFRMVPVSDIAEISDKMTRNEILTSNEVRQIIGMKPSNDPKADELRNKNLSQSAEDRKQSIQADPDMDHNNQE